MNPNDEPSHISDESVKLPVTSLEEHRTGSLGRVGEIAIFAGFRYSANAEWLGGVVIGNAVKETHDINSWVAAVAVAGAVAILDYPQARLAVRSSNPAPAPETKHSRVTAETWVFGSALWQGSAPTVNVSDSMGLESSRTRCLINSIGYGTAIGAWVSPLPVFSDGAEIAQDALRKALENPLPSAGLAVGISAVVYGALEGIKKIRTRRSFKSTE